MIYHYEAMNSAGQEVQGNIEASSDDEAIAKVRMQGLFPTRMKPATKSQLQQKPAESLDSLVAKARESHVIGGNLHLASTDSDDPSDDPPVVPPEVVKCVVMNLELVKIMLSSNLAIIEKCYENANLAVSDCRADTYKLHNAVALIESQLAEIKTDGFPL